MLGVDAMREIRNMGKNVPVIMVTTEAEKSRVIDAIRAGATNYVVKPFEPRTIVKKIRSALGLEQT
jgi:two-component system, chemotaxis family, chemotaxis protein CheY